MQEKIKELSLLTDQLLSRQKEALRENAALKQRIYVLENSVEKLKQTETELRALKEWKKNTLAVLKRLAVKVDKEIAKSQPGKTE